MTEAQSWVLIGVFAAALFGMLTIVSTMFLRVLRSGNSKYDQFVAGNTDALSGAAKLGHLLFTGTAGGCTACHARLTQGSGERAAIAATHEGLPFEHPEDIGDEWQSTGCYECHTGVQP